MEKVDSPTVKADREARLKEQVDSKEEDHPSQEEEEEEILEADSKKEEQFEGVEEVQDIKKGTEKDYGL